MSHDHNEYERSHSQVLGMAISTARSILYRNLIFQLVKESGKNICFRCSEPIESVEEFSVDHIKAWRKEPNAATIYFDLNNIGFSHLACNCGARRCVLSVTSSTGFKGVCYEPQRRSPKKYKAIASKTHIGHFLTAKEAAEAYDKVAVEKYGERAITNKMLGLI